jgi:peptide/nickel transport system permease protein
VTQQKNHLDQPLSLLFTVPEEDRRISAVPLPAVGVAPAKASVALLRLRRVGRAVVQPLAAFVPVFVFGTMITFALGSLSGLSPAGLQLGESATPEAVAALEHNWGLDRPIYVQYFDWFTSLFRGDLGRSWSNGQPISDQLFQRALISLSVAGLALVIGITLGFALGALAGLRQGTAIDRGITAFATFISVMPAFVVGIVLVAIFAVGLHLLPSAGYIPIERGPGKWLSHIILPALALSFDMVADVARQLRVGLIQARRENYVIGALVRGLSERRVFWVHVVRNAIGPTLTILGMKFANLLGGAVVLESIFALSGYGVFASQSALHGDVPAVQGVLVVSVVLVVAFNLVVNLVLSRVMPAARRGI